MSATNTAARLLKLGALEPAKTALFICDVQEVFRPHVKHFGDVVKVANKLIEGMKPLKVPIFISEQYPKGLGHTAQDVNTKMADLIYPKTSFSMLNTELLKNLNPEIKSVVIVGMETHVCVEQTVISLLADEYYVHLVADGVSSRSNMDRELALERMRALGAFVTTAENVLFKLVRDKNHPEFKRISKLVKEEPTNDAMAYSKL